MENGGFFRSVYTAGWKTRPPDWKYKHGAQLFFFLFFSLFTLTLITVEQSKSLRKRPSFGKSRHFPSAEVLLRSDETLDTFNFNTVFARFIFFMARQHGRLQMLSSFILQPLRSLALCGETERPPARITFQELLCGTSSQTNRWEPRCEVLAEPTNQSLIGRPHGRSSVPPPPAGNHRAPPTFTPSPQLSPVLVSTLLQNNPLL